MSTAYTPHVSPVGSRISARRLPPRLLAGSVIALGLWAGAAAPALAQPNAGGTDPNPFSNLRCDCTQKAPVSGPELAQQIAQGLQEGRTAWLPGLPAPHVAGQNQPQS